MTERKLSQYESRWPHRLAVLLCGATFPLIWVGGLVTTYNAGMAVPDWPSTYGYNLLAYPPATWFFGPWDLFIEHGHRLLGATVGLLAIAFAASVFICDPRRWMRASAVIALALVIVQGGLGGTRVLLDERQLAMVHGCLGPAFFGYSVALAVFTSRLWHDADPAETPAGGKLHRLAFMTVALAYLQLVLGAQLRHIPIMASPRAFQAAVVFHLATGLIVAGHALALTRHIVCHARSQRALLRPAVLLSGLIFCQLLLGPASWVVKYGWPGWLAELPLTAAHTIHANGMVQSLIVTGHVALGSLVIAAAVLVFVRSLRLLRTKTVAIGSSALLMGMTA